jgi:hypothetical protein
MNLRRFDSKWTRFVIFGVLIAGWIAFVWYSWYTGRTELGAAAIGAGPLALYSIYDELVNQPILKVGGPITYEKSLVRTHVDGQTLTQHLETDAPVFLNKPVEAVYPVIYANVQIRNSGSKTADSCSSRVLTEVTDPYFGRWGDEANEQSVDLHPGATRTLTLMRFVPRDLELGQFNSDLGHQYIVTRIFDALEPGYEGEGIEIDGFSYHIQHPVHQNKEERRLGGDQGTFFGRQMRPKDRYNVELELGASDWGRQIESVEPVVIDSAIQQGTWEPSFEMYNRYEGLVAQLEEHGW